MKKLYSTIMLLAVMVAALSLTACGGSDDKEGGDGGGGDIIIEYNGNTIDYDEYGVDLSPVYQPKIAEGAGFTIFCPFDFAVFTIIYPRSEFGKLPSSYFKVGQAIDPKDVELSFTDISNETVVAQYRSGNAKVVANDGKYISVSFNNFRAVSSDRDINIKKGVIKYLIRDDYK